jgi:hypothetical protein
MSLSLFEHLSPSLASFQDLSGSHPHYSVNYSESGRRETSRKFGHREDDEKKNIKLNYLIFIFFVFMLIKW